jgi:hypothetical protein
MRKVLLASLIVVGASQAAMAVDTVCEDLWYDRNQIFKEAGLCFKTRAAIEQFGNAGCQYDYVEDVPLSPYNRRKVEMIAREERRVGCRR